MPPKRRRSPSPSILPLPALSTALTEEPALSHSPHASKKLKLLAEFNSTSPFPTFQHPTAAEAKSIHALLASHTPGGAPVHQAPSSGSNSATTCGHAPNVLDALIGTILSQNTSSANSSAAKRSLDAAFGTGESGFAKMVAAKRDDIVTAIRCGGLANRKAKIIQEALSTVKEKHGRFDLQHLAAPGVTDEQAMQELVSLDGVGPKTAACVLSFCLGRQAFAVDTHVFRLAKLLGWMPKSADRVGAQAHLELRIPPELKYGLHVMMVRHGRVCKGCKKDGKGSCVLKTWVKENGVEGGKVESEGEHDIKDLPKMEADAALTRGQARTRRMVKQ
ncbi:DNA glycosylase [Leucogyrophana mollusca]|uniref:DNA glycosylase n=1 Tax=Leucogyrophana mollusca TaxID=85980 RepID=A0ACB8B084_9AGAM|nr:DNA glycosylase [Leucogyrophana mollusca]